MTPAELAASADSAEAPPSGLAPLVEALWWAKKCGDSADHPAWTTAHNIAQDIHTPAGSWVHALLHLIERDQWNADYWFTRAGKPSRKVRDTDALWQDIATSLV
jgi:hypothetical protein